MKYFCFYIFFIVTLQSLFAQQVFEKNKFHISAGIVADSGNDIWSKFQGVNLSMDYSRNIWHRFDVEMGLFYSQFSGFFEISKGPFIDSLTGEWSAELNPKRLYLSKENPEVFEEILTYSEVKRAEWGDFLPGHRKFQTYAFSMGLSFDFLKSKKHDLFVGYHFNLGYTMDYELGDYWTVKTDIPEIGVVHSERYDYSVHVPAMTNALTYEYDFILRYDYYLKNKYGIGVQFNRRDNNQTLVSTHVFQFRTGVKF